MSKNNFLFIILLLSTFSLQAQNTRLSFDFYVGSPATLTYFTPSLSPFGGIGIKYCLLKEISVAAQISAGTIAGKNYSANNNFISPDENNNYLSFTNQFIQYTLEGQLNLERLFGMRRFLHQLNPFLVVGSGKIYASQSAVRVAGKGQRTYDAQNYYTAYVGINFKYYLNPTLDLTFGTNFNSSQTFYLDAVPIDRKLDNYLLSYVGVSYKVGARKDFQHIEWNNVILKDRIYIPDIEKHIGQPFDEAGTLFLFNKDTINKIIAQNTELKNKSQQLETKTNQLVVENAAQQKQIDSMQNQLTTLKISVDTMQNRSVTEKIVEKIVAKELKGIANNNKTTISKNKQQKQNVEPEKVLKGKSKSIQLNPIKQVEPENIIANNGKLPSNELSDGLNKIDNVVAPVAKYNIIIGAYSGEKYAAIYRNKIRAKGYHAAVFKSSANSKMFRVCVFTSENRTESLKVLRKVRNEIEPDAWIHIFYQK